MALEGEVIGSRVKWIVAAALAGLAAAGIGYLLTGEQAPIPHAKKAGQAGITDRLVSEEPIPKGKSEYDQYCGRCHREDELSTYLAQQPVDAKRSNLITFLSRHGGSSNPVDMMIVDYLLAITE